MPDTREPAPIHRSDLAHIPAYQLAELTFVYKDDPESIQLIVDELFSRGIDPYA